MINRNKKYEVITTTEDYISGCDAIWETYVHLIQENRQENLI